MVFAPESVIQKDAGLLNASVSPDLGLVWSKEGVARLFASKEVGAPNLYKAPSSVVLVTADRFAIFGLTYIFSFFSYSSCYVLMWTLLHIVGFTQEA